MALPAAGSSHHKGAVVAVVTGGGHPMMANEPATAQPGCGIGGRGSGEGPAMGRGGGIDCRDVAKEEAEVAKDSLWRDWAEERMEQPMVEQEAAKSAVMASKTM